MSLVLSVSFSREKMSPFFSLISLRSSSSGTMRSPASLTSVTVNFLPSVTLTVRKMSFLSGVIDTWVESIVNSR